MTTTHTAATDTIPPLPATATHEESRLPVIAANLTSDVFNESNPPRDWADMSLLIPHEAIRRQMTMMVQSAAAMPDEPMTTELWKVTLFAKWYIDYFFVSVHEHHDNEENIYFPWIESKIPIPEKKLSHGHEELMTAMQQMKEACESICQKGGQHCSSEIALLKNTIPVFETDMRSHLQEEEQLIPKLLRENFTQEEESVIVNKIAEAGGLTLLKTMFPAICDSMKLWVTPEFFDEFCKSLPEPVMHLAFTYFVPDYENVVVAMRDAPTLTTEPELKNEESG